MGKKEKHYSIYISWCSSRKWISVEKKNILLKAIIDRPHQFGLQNLLSETYHMIGLTLPRIDEARKLSLTISNLN